MQQNPGCVGFAIPRLTAIQLASCCFKYQERAKGKKISWKDGFYPFSWPGGRHRFCSDKF